MSDYPDGQVYYDQDGQQVPYDGGAQGSAQLEQNMFTLIKTSGHMTQCV